MGHDVVVVGGGAAGLNAALVLARARRRVAVVDLGEPRNAPATHMHGFLSRDGLPPAQLLEIGRAEITSYGAELIRDRVESLAPGFVVRLASGQSLEARAVLVATGLRDELPDIPGVRSLWGTDVLHCPYCHGYEVRDAALGVVGGDNRPFTLHQAALIRLWSPDVIFFPNRIVLEPAERARLEVWGVRIVEGSVSRVVTSGDRLSGVELADGQVIPRSAVFVGPRFVPNDELLTKFGCDTLDNGWVATDPSGATSVPGLWAAGNVVSSPAQVVMAAAAGATSAIAINHYLLEEDIQLAIDQG